MSDLTEALITRLSNSPRFSRGLDRMAKDTVFSDCTAGVGYFLPPLVAGEFLSELMHSYMVLDVQPKRGCLYATLIELTNRYTAYDPTTQEQIGSGRFAVRNGVCYFPSASAPPVGSLVGDPGCNISVVATVSSYGDGVSILTFSAAPPTL